MSYLDQSRPILTNQDQSRPILTNLDQYWLIQTIPDQHWPTLTNIIINPDQSRTISTILTKPENF